MNRSRWNSAEKMSLIMVGFQLVKPESLPEARK